MFLPNLIAFFLCCFLGYTLWVATYAVCSMIAVGIGLLDLFSMGYAEFMFCLVLFCGGAVLVVSGLLFFYYLLSIIFSKERVWGELVFVIFSGFIATVLLALPGSHAAPFAAMLIAWGFFSLPALYTVLCLRGWEWYNRVGGLSPPSHTTGRAIYGIRRFPIRV